MALSATRLRDRIDTALAALDPDGYGNPDNADGRAAIKGKMFQAIAEGLIAEITLEARAVGDDSNGDTHELTIE